MAFTRMAGLLAVSALISLAACAPDGAKPDYAQGYDDGCLSSSMYTGVVPGLQGFDERALDESADYRAGARAGMSECGFEPPKETLATWLPLPFADHIPLSSD